MRKSLPTCPNIFTAQNGQKLNFWSHGACQIELKGSSIFRPFIVPSKKSKRKKVLQFSLRFRKISFHSYFVKAHFGCGNKNSKIFLDSKVLELAWHPFKKRRGIIALHIFP